mgnify:CR=1 FL=1|jgi:glutathione S-transferase
MKLYFAPGACSLAPHILLRETGLAFELVRVDLASHTYDGQKDFYAINNKGSVPVLELDDGERLTEGPVIAQWICDRAGRTDLMPAAGTLARYRVMEWQNFVTSELHKSYSPLFKPDLGAEIKDWFRQALRKRYEYVDRRLQTSDYLASSTYTAADTYLFVVTNWAGHVGVDLSGLAALDAFMNRVRAREAVQAALAAEGLVKKA